MFLDSLPTDLHQIGKYLLNDIQVSHEELEKLAEETRPVDVTSKELDEAIELLVEDALRKAGASEDSIERSTIDHEKMHRDFINYNIDHHLLRIERCHRIIEDLEEGQVDSGIAYFEEHLRYRKEVAGAFKKMFPRFKFQPEQRELHDAHDKTIRKFIRLLQAKKSAK